MTVSVVLESTHIAGLGPGSFALLIIAIVAVLGCVVSWKLQKFLISLIIGLFVFFIVFLFLAVSPKDNNNEITSKGDEDYDYGIIERVVVALLLALGILVGVIGYCLHMNEEYNPKEY